VVTYLMPTTAAPGGDSPVTVARLITRLNIGGPSIQATHLTTALEPLGFHTRLFHGRLGEGEGDMRYLLKPGADVVLVSTLCRPVSPLDDLRSLVRLYRELKRLRPSIVHTHMAKAGLIGRLAAAAYNATRGSAPRARLVHTYHGHVLEGYFSSAATAVFIGLERALARLSDAIVAISPAIRRELLEAYRIGRESQYRVVRLGFDLAPFAAIDDGAREEARRTLSVPDGVPVIATVGRLTAIKRHTLFLDVFKRVIDRHPAAVALIAGDGDLRAGLEAQAASLGIASQVRFLGWRRDLATIYAATDVFLLTSRNEGTPVALIEAMASGVPGVSTDVGGVRDVIGDAGATGEDDRQLAEGVLGFLADPVRRKRAGELARARVLQHFDIDRLVREIAALYRDLLSRDGNDSRP
jgi:glycosyltransferase involved in cell wall biosynthesis